MENKLAENIRRYRKDLGFTQDELAERLGVTLGAVSKWERGSSEPDLGFIMELADLFHVSVDALIGFNMHGMDADSEADRLDTLFQAHPCPEILTECEAALRKFPNNFRLVHGTAEAARMIGSMHHNEEYLRRSLELYQHALELFSQNKDPDLSEVDLRNSIATCWSELKDYRRAIEEYKKNNVNGINNAKIGQLMIQYDNKPKEGVEYLLRAFLQQLTDLCTVVLGYIRYYMTVGNWSRALRTAQWFKSLLEGLKEDPSRRSFLNKLSALLHLMTAVVLDNAGDRDASLESLRKAVRTARTFDTDPVYTMENTLFTEIATKNIPVYDDAGPTAVEGLKTMLEEIAPHVTDAFREQFEKELH